MPKLSVCIEMFWGDLSFEERIKRVGALGIPAAEFWFWGGKDLASIKAAADKAGVVVPIFFLEAKMPAVHPNAAAALCVVYVPQYFRVVRNQSAQVKAELFIEAARSLGAGPAWILRRYLFRNVITSVPIMDIVETDAKGVFVGKTKTLDMEFYETAKVFFG